MNSLMIGSHFEFIRGVIFVIEKGDLRERVIIRGLGYTSQL